MKTIKISKKEFLSQENNSAIIHTKGYYPRVIRKEWKAIYIENENGNKTYDIKENKIKWTLYTNIKTNY